MSRRPCPPADEIKTTTCYMCACRCGIQVHLKDGKIRYIDGNRKHPVNRGVICGKGAAGIMQHYAPSRLRAPLKRVGPRGSGEFVEIGWDEALATADGLAGRGPQDRSQASSPSSPAAISRSRSRDGGRCSSARRILQPMAASARSTWPPAASTRSAGRSGSSASPTGTTRNISCSSASPRTTAPTPSRSRLASSRSAAPRSSPSTRSARATTPLPTNGSASSREPTGC